MYVGSFKTWSTRNDHFFHSRLEESVFERFEEAAGGELMRACVCMLEVSRHGLLEMVIFLYHFRLEESVFERFEEAAGGELMRACVCMLEVSRHGLLEMELLALLGQKERV